MTLEYEGTFFHGWQKQPGLRTVEGELRESLKLLTKEEIDLTGASRTDTGVHALGQVVSFHINEKLNLLALKKSLNCILPEDICVINLEEVEENFNARFHAVSKRYFYIISLKRSAVLRNFSLYCPNDLDIDRMNKGIEYIQQGRDFRVFSKWGKEKTTEKYEKNTACKIYKAKWKKRKGLLIFEIMADRFLHNMVRMIVGTSIEIGRGRFEPEVVLEAFNKKDKKLVGPTCPAKGLFLMNVIY